MTMPKIARPMPCNLALCGMSRMARMPAIMANGPWKGKDGDQAPDSRRRSPSPARPRAAACASPDPRRDPPAFCEALFLLVIVFIVIFSAHGSASLLAVIA